MLRTFHQFTHRLTPPASATPSHHGLLAYYYRPPPSTPPARHISAISHFYWCDYFIAVSLISPTHELPLARCRHLIDTRMYLFRMLSLGYYAKIYSLRRRLHLFSLMPFIYCTCWLLSGPQTAFSWLLISPATLSPRHEPRKWSASSRFISPIRVRAATF
jgi:hypothetical protein